LGPFQALSKHHCNILQSEADKDVCVEQPTSKSVDDTTISQPLITGLSSSVTFLHVSYLMFLAMSKPKLLLHKREG